MADIVAGHQISFRFRGPDNKPTGRKLTIYRDGDTAMIEAQWPYPDQPNDTAIKFVILGSDTCNNVTKWLEAVHAFLTLDIPTLDTIRDEGQPQKGAPGVSA